MRLSFSTRGWQSLDWEQLLESARESGMNGIELYDLYKRHDLIDRGCAFDRYHAAATARQLRENGMAVPCLDSSLDLSIGITIDFVQRTAIVESRFPDGGKHIVGIATRYLLQILASVKR